MKNDTIGGGQGLLSNLGTLSPLQKERTVPNILSIVIGTSTGGVAALYEILPKFPKTEAYAIFIALQVPPAVGDSIVSRLDGRCSLNVKEAQHAMVVEPNNAYIIPGGSHGEVMKWGSDIRISLHKGPKVNFVRPSADVIMKSVAEVFKENSIGVLLTGIGIDGTQGMKAIKDAGGATIAQDEKTSCVFAMPRSAIDSGCVDAVLPLQDIPPKTMALVDEKTSDLAVQI